MAFDRLRIAVIGLLPVAAFVAVLAGQGATASALVDALLVVAGIVCLGLATLVAGLRWQAGPLLLNLGPAPRQRQDYQWAAFWAGASCLVVLLGYDRSWLLFCAGNAVYFLAQAMGRVHLRAHGITGVEWGYMPWARVQSYAVTESTLVLSYEPRFGHADSTVAIPCSSVQRTRATQVLVQYVQHGEPTPS